MLRFPWECLGFGGDRNEAGRGSFELNGFHSATLCLASISQTSHQPPQEAEQ